MTRVTDKFGKKLMIRIAAIATIGLGVSGCTYDMGLGYASDGYNGSYYECDPYSPFDSYYDCDNSYGFYNIGFGGGWYENYWYPGYGFYLFDNYGRRYSMRDNYRRYWGERRQNWYRENRGRNREGGRYEGRGRGYSGNATPGAIGWSERSGGRVRGGDDNRRGRDEGRRDRNRGWQGGQGNGVNAIPTPTPEAARGEAGRRGRGDGMRRGGQDRPAWRGNDGAGAAPVLRQDRPAAGRGDGGGRAFRAPPQPAPEASGQSAATRAMPATRSERATAPRQNRSSGERVQEQ